MVDTIAKLNAEVGASWDNSGLKRADFEMDRFQKKFDPNKPSGVGRKELASLMDQEAQQHKIRQAKQADRAAEFKGQQKLEQMQERLFGGPRAEMDQFNSSIQMRKRLIANQERMEASARKRATAAELEEIPKRNARIVDSLRPSTSDKAHASIQAMRDQFAQAKEQMAGLTERTNAFVAASQQAPPIWQRVVRSVSQWALALGAVAIGGRVVNAVFDSTVSLIRGAKEGFHEFVSAFEQVPVFGSAATLAGKVHDEWTGAAEEARNLASEVKNANAIIANRQTLSGLLAPLERAETRENETPFEKAMNDELRRHEDLVKAMREVVDRKIDRGDLSFEAIQRLEQQFEEARDKALTIHAQRRQRIKAKLDADIDKKFLAENATATSKITDVMSGAAGILGDIFTRAPRAIAEAGKTASQMTAMFTGQENAIGIARGSLARSAIGLGGKKATDGVKVTGMTSLVKLFTAAKTTLVQIEQKIGGPATAA